MARWRQKRRHDYKWPIATAYPGASRTVHKDPLVSSTPSKWSIATTHTGANRTVHKIPRCQAHHTCGQSPRLIQVPIAPSTNIPWCQAHHLSGQSPRLIQVPIAPFIRTPGVKRTIYVANRHDLFRCQSHRTVVTCHATFRCQSHRAWVSNAPPPRCQSHRSKHLLVSRAPYKWPIATSRTGANRT